MRQDEMGSGHGKENMCNKEGWTGKTTPVEKRERFKPCEGE
jgi:hypothetical protein